jgi:hypothetical protein
MSQKYFNQILQRVYKKSPLQKKKLENYLASCDESFFGAAEKFSKVMVLLIIGSKCDYGIN